MIEIQCTSCNTRYRIDERILPEDAPTFKCSRCGHVFSSQVAPPRPRKAAPAAVEAPTPPDPEPPAPPPSATFHAPPIAPSAPFSGASHSAPTPQSGPLSATIHVDTTHGSAPQSGAIHSVPPPPNRHEQVHENTFSAQPVAAAPEPEIPPSRPGATDEPLDRTFDETPPKPDTSERLRFDFSGETRNPQHDKAAAAALSQFTARAHRDEGWEAGEAPSDLTSPSPRQGPAAIGEPDHSPGIRPPEPIQRSFGPTMFAPAASAKPANGTHVQPPAVRPRYDAPPVRPAISAAPRAPVARPREAVAEELAEAGPGKTHTAGYFVGMFLVIAAAFTAASFGICAEPGASARTLGNAPVIGKYFAPPIVPATLVALHGVKADYRKVKGGRVALVITGQAENLGGEPLHLVRIGADLIDGSDRPLARRSAFSGNEMAARMVAEMTPHEIEFSQDLNPRPGFSIAPSASSPFLMVFLDPPHAAQRVRLAILKADAAPSAQPAASAAHAG